MPIINFAEEVPEVIRMEKEEMELKKRLREQHLKEINKQVDSQGKFIADWPKYSQDVEQIKVLEEKTHELEDQLRKLEERKTELLNKQNGQSN